VEDFYEHIDDYKNGLLEGEVLAAFEQSMADNPSHQLAVDNYESAKGISEALLEVDMLQTLQRLGNEEATKTIESHKIIDISHKENNHSHKITNRSVDNSDQLSFSDTKPKVKRFSLRKLAIAASFLAIVCVGGWWMVETVQNNQRKSYVLAQLDELGLKPVDKDATKSIDTVGMSAFQKGKYYYSLNRFEESIKWLEKMVAEEKDEKLLSEGYYWLGHGYVKLGRLDDAEKAWGESDEEEVAKMILILAPNE